MNRFYNNYIKKNRYKREEGVTIIDLVIAIIIMSVFVGVITTLMTGIYKQSLEVQISSNAMSYATIILEKIDEKSFEEVQNPNFVENLKASGEVTIPEEYTIKLNVENFDNVSEEVSDVIKKATVTVNYKIRNEEKSISISKLKVKEIYNGEE